NPLQAALAVGGEGALHGATRAARQRRDVVVRQAEAGGMVLQQEDFHVPLHSWVGVLIAVASNGLNIGFRKGNLSHTGLPDRFVASNDVAYGSSGCFLLLECATRDRVGYICGTGSRWRSARPTCTAPFSAGRPSVCRSTS